MTKLTESDIDAAIADKAWPPAPRRSYTGVPIGHGALADIAAEPIEFTRLLQHLKRGHIVSDWPDTVPTGPAAFDDTQGAWPACGGSCSERERPCPRPSSCWLTVDREDDGIGVVRGLLWAIGITAAALAAVWVVAGV